MSYIRASHPQLKKNISCNNLQISLSKIKGEAKREIKSG